jgi:hypothetical protein
MTRLTAEEYRRLFEAYRRDRLQYPEEPLPTGVFAKWGWHLRIERDFRRELELQGIRLDEIPS